MFRLLFWAAIVYLAYRVINMLVFSGPPKAGDNQVKGKPRNPGLDLSNMNVEDAKFEEIDEKKKNGR